jgi:hypothetical protein
MAITPIIRPKKAPLPPSTASKVEGQYGIELRINDAYFPVTPSVLSGLRIISNIHTPMPTVQFESSDLFSLLTNQVDGFSEEGEGTLGDGVKISIGLSDGRFDPELLNFRVMSVPKISPDAKYQKVSVVGFLDAIKWWRGIYRGAYTGTSTDIMKRIAVDCGLGFYGPHTFGDSMTWIPANQNYSAFAHKIATHAWSDDSSCPLTALDTDAILRYVDLNRLVSETPVATAKYLKPVEQGTDFRVLHCVIRSPSGVANMTGGYKGVSLEQNFKGVVTEHGEVQIVRQGNYLDSSKSLSEEVGPVRSKLVPLDAGNIHKNYYRAEHQNKRLSAYFSLHAEIYTDTVTNLGLLETITLDMADQKDGADNRNYSGVYFVSAKVVGINAGRYFEKLRLTTNSRGLNPAKDMK